MTNQVQNPRKAYALCGIAILLWGSVSTIGKLFLKDAPVIEFLFYMSLFASTTLFLGLLLQNKSKEILKQSIPNYLKLFFIGVVGILIYNILYFEALTRTSAADVSIIASIWPILLVLLTSLFFKQRLSAKSVLALVLGFTGVFLATSDHLSFTANTQSLIGDILVLLSAIIFAIFFILSNRIQINNYLFMFLCYISSTLAAGLYLFTTNGFTNLPFNVLLTALYVGALPSAVGFAFFSEALRTGNVSRIANLANLTPFASLIYITILLKENPSLMQFIGLIVLICAIMLESIIALTQVRLSNLRKNFL